MKFKQLKFLYVIIVGIVLIGCQDKMGKMMHVMMSSPIDIKLSNLNIAEGKTYTLIVLHDSLECSRCAIRHLDEWDLLADTLEQFGVKVHIVLCPRVREYNDVKKLLDKTEIRTDVHVDSCSVFLKSNPQIPQNNILMHTFLLDKNNHVVLIGNPLSNKKIKELLFDIIKTKHHSKSN